MSYYITAKTTFTDKACLTAALEERFPEATILTNAAVRGYPGRTQPQADIVVRFRNPTSEAQGEYDLGFRLKQDGTYELVGEVGWRGSSYGICKYSEALSGVSGNGLAGLMEGITEPYIKAAVKKQLKNNPALNGYIMGKVGDKETEMSGKKKTVKHLRISGGSTTGNKGNSSGGWI